MMRLSGAGTQVAMGRKRRMTYAALRRTSAMTIRTLMQAVPARRQVKVQRIMGKKKLRKSLRK